MTQDLASHRKGDTFHDQPGGTAVSEIVEAKGTESRDSAILPPFEAVTNLIPPLAWEGKKSKYSTRRFLTHFP